MSELGKRVDLKPCPFCGAVYMGRTDGFIHQTDCFLTFIASYRVGPYSGEAAEKAWNSRALLAPREEEPGLREALVEWREQAKSIYDTPIVTKIDSILALRGTGGGK